MAMVDVLRVGRVRECRLATAWLDEALGDGT
jgi:hypothetical protein